MPSWRITIFQSWYHEKPVKSCGRVISRDKMLPFSQWHASVSAKTSTTWPNWFHSYHSRTAPSFSSTPWFLDSFAILLTKKLSYMKPSQLKESHHTIVGIIKKTVKSCGRAISREKLCFLLLRFPKLPNML